LLSILCRRQLCAAYCSIAELYLTDLCDEPDAESSCEAVLISALAIDDASSRDGHCAAENSGDIHMGPPSPDALQTMANFRLSQSRVPEALECILKAYDRMKVGCEAMSALVGLANTDSGEMGRVEQEAKSRELVDVEAASSLPEYHFRCQTAKIMLECASLIRNGESDATETSNQCVESAIQVLGSLLAENDEVIEVWYLLGCAFMASTPSNLESAHHYLENALSMLTKAKEDLEESLGDDENDENELEAIECQIIEVKKKLGTYNDDRDEEMMNE
jgi:tetratricopeptide (TPR) repeat protein